MGEVDRIKQSRGVEYTDAHLAFLADIKTEVEGRGIESIQMRHDKGMILVNMSVPFLDGRFYQANRERLGYFTDPFTAVATPVVEDPYFCMPFLIPPLQHLWPDDQPNLGAANPPMMLEEVSFSFDQRGESAGITGPDHAGDDWVNSGKIFLEEVANLDVNLSIQEHTPTIFTDHDNEEAWKPRGEIFSLKIPASAYANRLFRANPLARSKVSKPIHPFRTYLVCINCTGLSPGDNFGGAAPDEWMALVSVSVELRISHQLVTRSAGVAIQNIPLLHDGAQTKPTLAIDLPEAGDPMFADGTEGINEEGLVVVDEFIRHGLHGGYTRFGTNWGDLQCVTADAVPHVVVVPMWQNQSHGEINKSNVGFVGNSGASPHAAALLDYRPVPIDYPFVIHHVYAVLNWQTSQETATWGDSGLASLADGLNLQFHISLSMATGLRGDHHTYDMIAAADFALDNTTDHGGFLVDRIGYPYAATNPNPVIHFAGLAPPKYMLEIVELPLVNNPGETGPTLTSPTGQGRPVWVSPTPHGGYEAVAPRRDIGGASPHCRGAEQWLEVRWEIDPIVANFGEVVNALCLDAMVIGYGGAWVIIVGEVYPL